MKLGHHIFEKATSKVMAAIMAAPISDYICPYALFSRKNRDYSNVRDLVLDRDAAISAAIIFVPLFHFTGSWVPLDIKSTNLE